MLKIFIFTKFLSACAMCCACGRGACGSELASFIYIHFFTVFDNNSWLSLAVNALVFVHNVLGSSRGDDILFFQTSPVKHVPPVFVFVTCCPKCKRMLPQSHFQHTHSHTQLLQGPCCVVTPVPCL